MRVHQGHQGHSCLRVVTLLFVIFSLNHVTPCTGSPVSQEVLELSPPSTPPPSPPSPSSSPPPPSPSRNKLIVMMIDAFRYDYYRRPELIGIREVITSGVRAQYVEPVFPSITYPNMFSQVTGMYVQDHGIVANNMYDPVHNELFYSSGGSSSKAPVDKDGHHPFWWNQSEPIWINAERGGVRTGVYYWEGCQVEIGGVSVSYCRPYKSLVDMEWRDYEDHHVQIYRDLIFNLKHDKWDFGMVYYEMVDAMGHAGGIDSNGFKNAIVVTDNIITKLLAMLSLEDMRDKVNIVLISDHGMTFLDEPQANFVDLSEYLTYDEGNFRVDMGSGTIVQLFPSNEDLLWQMYHNLTRYPIEGCKVYLKEDLPDRFKIKNHIRTSPIYIVSNPGWNVRLFNDAWHEPGRHGYDPHNNPEMFASFLGTGPDFKRGYVSQQPISMTDHYNTFCHLLKVPCHPNDGDFNRVKDMFVN